MAWCFTGDAACAPAVAACGNVFASLLAVGLGRAVFASFDASLPMLALPVDAPLWLLLVLPCTLPSLLWVPWLWDLCFFFLPPLLRRFLSPREE